MKDPANGTIWDKRLWGVAPTHKDPKSGDTYVSKDGRWFNMVWSPANGRYVGFESTNQEAHARLVRI